MYNLVSAAPSVGSTDASVIQGTLLVFNSRASVLIDIDTSYLFIPASCTSALGLDMSHLASALVVDTSVGRLVPLDQVCRGYKLVIAYRHFVLDLIVIDKLSFDVILGMN